MPCPITTGLIVSLEGDSGGLSKDAGSPGTTLCTTNGDNVGYWAPLSQGNSLGNFTNGTSGTHLTYQTGDFANSIPGVRGDGTATLTSASSLSAISYLDIFAVVKLPTTISVANERIFDAQYDTGFTMMRHGSTASSWGVGVKQTADPYSNPVAASDGSVHVFHGSWVASTGAMICEVDGHTVQNLTASGTGATAANALWLFGSNTGSISAASLSTLYVFSGASAILPTLSVNTILNYIASPSRYNLTLSGVPATGGYRRQGGFTGGFQEMTGGF